MRQFCKNKKELAILRAISQRKGYITFTPEERKFILMLWRKRGKVSKKMYDDGTLLGMAVSQLHC